MLRVVAICLLLSLGLTLPAADIWVEGENAAHKGNTPHSWYDSVKTDALSGGAWISNFADTGPAVVGYKLVVPSAGSYTFWVRANHVGSALSYQVGDGEWTAVDFSADQRGAQNIASDNKPDLRFISWNKVGALDLPAGELDLHFRFESKNNSHGAIDCFVLSDAGFVPSGLTKPGAGGGGTERVPADPADAIWIEGEDASAKTASHHSWYDSVKKDALSGGQWLSHFDEDKVGSASYDFQVVEGDTFDGWVRANPTKAKLSYRLDGGEWVAVDFQGDQRGHQNIASDNKPDLRFIAWVSLGEFELAAGKHSIEFRMDSGPQNHGGIDAICFVRIPWAPAGAQRPSTIVEGSVGPGDWFAFTPDDDAFSDESVIDVSDLIPAPAGQFGFLQREGGELGFAQASAPSKFWATNGGPGSNGRNKTPEEMEQAAQWFRKHGINLIRQHTVVGAVGLLRADGTFDPDRIDAYDRWFATLKEHGIYSCWSVTYPHHGAILRASDGYDPKKYAELKAAVKGKGDAIVVNDYVNLDPELQAIVWRYYDALLNHVNPYTKLAYKDDPALAVLEVHNESNVFFHTLNELRKGQPPSFARMVRQGFFQFVKEKYGSKEAVAKAWGGTWDRDDKWEQGELGIMAPFHFGSDGPQYEYAGQHRRGGDYVEYLAKLQRGYYERRIKQMRDAGFKGVTVTTAWKAVGFSSLANLWADDAGDVIDRHNYFGGGDGGHRITEGKVSNQTHLSQPGRGLFAIHQEQIEDKPYAVSEWSMMPPAPYKAEAAPLMAFYGLGLQGWDISYHFASGAIRFGDGWPGLGKYCSHTPHYMGQFPALARAVYEGHIATGTPIAQRRVGDDVVYAGKDVLGMSVAGEHHDIKDFQSGVATPPECFAIGPVTTRFVEGEESETGDLQRYWDQDAKRITSTSGELVWDYGAKLVTIKAAKTQGLIGHPGQATHQLPGATISQVETPFVSLLLTALDGQAIASSKRILITAMARDKQTGAEYNEDWSQLITMGAAPLLLEPVQATIALAGAKPIKVMACDIYGVPRGEPLELGADGSFRIDGTHRAYYYYIER